MLLRVGALVVVAALHCSEVDSGSPDAAVSCVVDQAPAEALDACGTPPPQCCNLPWCGPDVPSNAWFCANHSGGASWCCACADPEGTGTVQWTMWKMECGLLGQHDAGDDGLPDAGTD